MTGPTQLTADVVQRINCGQDEPEAVLRADFFAWQLDGSQPFVERQSINVKCDPSSLIPEDLAVQRQFIGGVNGSSFKQTVLVRGHECGALIDVQRDNTMVYVSASTAAAARSIVDSIVARAPVVEEETPGDVHVLFWYRDTSGYPGGMGKPISAPAWNDIARNYPPRVARALGELIALDRPSDRGKLILWHGEPGTGKTTALRALARGWQDWCSTHYVSDPEAFFADPKYLIEVLSRPPLPSIKKVDDRWRLIIAEDSDEHLRTTARREAGAALGRLLNLSDGIFGQGSNTLVVLTTNERIDRLHPALTRPGRCLAEISFSRFTAEEASAWLPDGAAVPTEPTTLADLFERSGNHQRITSGSANEHHGAYL